MAKIVTVADVQLQLTGQESLTELNNKLEYAKENVKDFSLAYGESSEEVKKAKTQVTELEGAVESLNEKSLKKTKDNFKKIDSSSKSIVNGFKQMKNAASNLNSENVDLLGSVENLHAGFSNIKNSASNILGIFKNGNLSKTFANIGNAIKTKVVGGLNLAKTAGKAFLASLGIGLIITGISLIIENWEKLIGLIGLGKSESQKNLDIAQEAVKVEQGKLDAIGAQENILKLQGLSEKEILKLKQDQLAMVIKKQRVELDAAKVNKANEVARAERNKRYLKNVLKGISLALTLILKAADQVGKFLGKDWGLEDKIFDPIAELMFDPEEVAAEGDKTIEEAEKKLKKLENQQAGFQLKVNSINKKAADKNKKTADEAAAKKIEDDKLAKEEQAKLKQEAKEIAEAAAREKKERETDEFELRKQDLKAKYLEEKAILIAQGIETKTLKSNYDAELLQIEADKLKKEQDLRDTAAAEKRANEEADANASIKQKEKEAAAKAAIEQSAYNTAAAFSNLIGELGNENIKVQKAQALIQIGIDTASAISSLVKMSQANPANAPTGGIAGALQFATGLLQIGTNMAKAANILGSSGPQVGGGNQDLADDAANDAANNQQNRQQQQFKVFVTETDIANATSKRINLTQVGIVE